jgi:hypothetical protein
MRRSTPIVVASAILVGIGLVELRTLATTTTATTSNPAAGSAMRTTKPEAAARREPIAPSLPRVDAPVEPAIPSKQRRAAEAFIASAIARGEWQDRDREAFDLLARELPGDERAEVVRPLVIAVNAQHIRVDVTGPVL